MTAAEAYNQIIEADVLEDRREYDEQMLQTMYDLSQSEASVLYGMIQKNF